MTHNYTKMLTLKLLPSLILNSHLLDERFDNFRALPSDVGSNADNVVEECPS